MIHLLIGGVTEIKVVFNNIKTENKNLEPLWGFACVIKMEKLMVLFDTGSNGEILLSNMKNMGINPKEIDILFLSHEHYDHVGGVDEFLFINSSAEVIIPTGFSEGFKKRLENLGVKYKEISGFEKITEKMYSTGGMGKGIKEQALVLDSPQGLVIITGCAHPGILSIIKKVKKEFKRDIYLVMGGFHLGGYGKKEAEEIVKVFKKEGVKKVAPSHCTGEISIKEFKKQYEDDFIEGGLGATIKIP